MENSRSISTAQPPDIRDTINQGMRDSSQWVVKLIYRDRSGKITIRTVSPIRWLDAKSFLALCLCRQEPREFKLRRCIAAQLIPEHEVLMPVRLDVIES